MRLTVIGSKSDGNAYVLQNADEALLLECGLPFAKTLTALDYQLTKVVGCLVSHEHQDHAEHVDGYLCNGIEVYASKGTTQGIIERFCRTPRIPKEIPYNPDGTYRQFALGGFTIVPFKTIHSTEEPTGFYIHHREIGSMVFATDTAYLPQPFAGLCNVMIEANYDRDRLDARYWNGDISQRRYSHTRNGHMCIDTTIEALQANDLSKVNNIILLHLSEEHADPDDFQKRVQEATGKTTYVARPGLEIDFNATPF